MSADQRFGAYQLGDEVERAGRTVTWRAHLVEPVGTATGATAERRVVAGARVLVKTLRPGLHPSDGARVALRREAELLDRLRHPLLPTLLAAELEGVTPGLILLDAGGVRLGELLERSGQCQLVEALAIAAEVTRALDALHRAGVVHGSLRAGLVELGPDGAVRVQLGSALDPGDEPVDEPGDDWLAPPAELAPEQIDGAGADVRTDVYLVGLLLRQMLAPDAPVEELGQARPTRLGTRRQGGSRSTVGPVRGAAGAIVGRALAARPKDRFPDVASLHAELVRALRAETSLPVDHLVNQALARAGLSERVAGPAEHWQRAEAILSGVALRRLAGAAAVALGIVAAALLVRTVTEGAPSSGGAVRGVEQRAAQLRVLAQPWAEIHVDGKLVDVTPVGRPIVVAPGRHEVVFKHPNAPDQVRSVEVIAGQTVWLDVAMPIARDGSDAGGPGLDAAVGSP